VLDLAKSWRYVPLHVAVWDERAKSERILRFDFADTIARLQRTNPSAPYPMYRMFLREDFLRQMTKGNRIAARDINAVRTALQTESTTDAVAMLRPVAEDGGVQSQRLWLMYCDTKPFDGCGAGLVDALLPQAEERHVLPMILLALANARGIGVKKDESAAMTLLDAAEAQWGKGRAVVEYATLWSTIDKRAYPKSLQARLDRASAGGNPDPEIAAIDRRIDADSQNDASPKDLERLMALAGSGRRAVLATIATQLYYSPRRAESLPWLRRAAEAGLRDQQERLGYSLLYGDSLDLPLDREQGLRWLREAAHSGSTVAMYTLGSDAFARKEWAAAEGWFGSADVGGDSDGTFALVRLWADARPGVRGTTVNALKVLRTMSESGKDSAPEARRQWANVLLTAKAVPKDPAAAEKLLRQDADAGNAESQIALAHDLLDGQFGRKDEVEGVALYQKAMVDPKQGDNAADALAFWLYYSKDTPESRARAVSIWRGLGSRFAWNNLAWVLCTSRDPVLRNTTEGLALLDKLGKPEAQSAGTMDTFAACYAAAGRFDDAVRTQAKVVERSRAADADDADLPAMTARLDGYRAHKPYIETAQPASTR
jgi:TPR repeat protein